MTFLSFESAYWLFYSKSKNFGMGLSNQSVSILHQHLSLEDDMAYKKQKNLVLTLCYFPCVLRFPLSMGQYKLSSLLFCVEPKWLLATGMAFPQFSASKPPIVIHHAMVRLESLVILNSIYLNLQILSCYQTIWIHQYSTLLGREPLSSYVLWSQCCLMSPSHSG